MITHSEVKYLNEKYMKKKNKEINKFLYISFLKSILIAQPFIITFSRDRSRTRIFEL